jgi:hypothetical protein
MTLERIPSLYRAQPFQPFMLHLADGRDVKVKSPEFMSFSPSGRTIAVHEADESLRIVDLLLVTEAHVHSNGNAGSRRKPKGRQ